MYRVWDWELVLSIRRRKHVWSVQDTHNYWGLTQKNLISHQPSFHGREIDSMAGGPRHAAFRRGPSGRRRRRRFVRVSSHEASRSSNARPGCHSRKQGLEFKNQDLRTSTLPDFNLFKSSFIVSTSLHYVVALLHLNNMTRPLQSSEFESSWDD